MPARPLFIVCLCCLIIGVNISFAQKTNQPTPNLMLPIGHHLAVISARFSPDSKRIITTSDDKSAIVWDAETGSVLLILKDHKDVVSTAEFSSDGKKILTASWDNMIKVWDASTGEHLFTLKGHKDKVVSAHFSPDGTKILSRSSDGMAKLWNALTKRLITDLTDGEIKVTTAQFSPDGTKIVTGTRTGLVIIHDSKTGNGKLLGLEKDPLHNRPVISAQFSRDNRFVVSASADNTAKIWDVSTGKLLKTLVKHKETVNSAQFSPDGTKVVTSSDDNTSIIWNTLTGKDLLTLKGHSLAVNSALFSLNGEKIITLSKDNSTRIWNTATGLQDTVIKAYSGKLYSAALSPDSSRLVIAFYNGFNGVASIWDIKKDSLLNMLTGRTYWAYAANFSPDGQNIVTATDETAAKIWDSKTGSLLTVLKGHRNSILSAVFSPDGKNLMTSSYDGTTRLWDLVSGEPPRKTPDRQSANWPIAAFSPDGTKILYKSDDSTAVIRDTKTFTEYKTIRQPYYFYSAQFSPDGSKIITGSGDSTAKILDAATGNTIETLKGHEDEVLYAAYSPDGKKIVTASADQTAIIWNTFPVQQETVLIGHSDPVLFASFSPDNKTIITASEDKTAKIWDAKNGDLLFTLKGHTERVSTAQFDSSGKKIVTASGDNTFKVWNAENGKLLYTFFPIDSSDYLIVDKDNHFDGTENARNLLYFTCGTDKIGLDQVKGQLWVPDLAEKINNGKTIRENTLEQLDVCGQIPEVEAVGNTADEFQFTIKPRRGNLGEIVLYVNDIEVRNIKKEDLINNNGVFELNIRKDSLKNYFLANEENNVTLKAYTKGYGIASPEARITIEKDSSLSDIKPHLYALVVGTSKYKEPPKKSESLFDNNINLAYPSVDALAISQTLEQAAKKLYGDDHVHIYNLTTDLADSLKPVKQNIKNALDSIGKKATANDILFIFLSGHGVKDEENNNQQFYYMTADASDLADEAAFPVVGISTEELTDWIRPKNILAQKRILILDACHSGQAINNLLGNTQQSRPVPTGKVEDRSKMIKEFDKLNERSGLFILSASASNKLAFESDKYLHGYLTYSLLKTIKQQPDILEDGKNLDISRWFNAAGKSVNAMAKEEGNDQKTQIFSVINFHIGEVDSSVIASIRLEGDKPLFISCNFQNTDSAIKGDDLGLTRAINDALQKSSKEADAKINFAFSSPAGTAYSLSGTYKLKDNEIKAEFILLKGKERIKQFEEPEKGTTGNLSELAKNIAEKAIAWIHDNK